MKQKSTIGKVRESTASLKLILLHTTNTKIEMEITVNSDKLQEIKKKEYIPA